ncbi:MAG: GNAT family N-acetyltransferase [Desulfobacteraceae bacterium]|nr:GNAT family N-acetyltransferase [Desulfobacteraceae bacterium]
MIKAIGGKEYTILGRIFFRLQGMPKFAYFTYSGFGITQKTGKKTCKMVYYLTVNRLKGNCSPSFAKGRKQSRHFHRLMAVPAVSDRCRYATNRKAMNKILFEIRSTKISDASDISELSKQLGYSTSELEIQRRLSFMLKSTDHAIYVAFVPNRKVVGWIHVHESQTVESGSFAEIGGFVVSEKFRKNGIGKKLLHSAEQWTIKNNLIKLRVRSKIEREDAKIFYSNMGFSVSKKQRVFDKIMS